MSHSRAHATPVKRARTVVGLVVLGGLVIVLGALAWVGVRGLQAKDALESAIPLAQSLKAQVVAGEASEAGTTAVRLADYAERARSRTNDPVWRTVELVPFLGPNLRAVRELAAVIDDVADNAVLPLVSLTDSLALGDFKPVDGKIDVKPLITAQPAVAAANTTLTRAAIHVHAIGTEDVLGVVRSAVIRLQAVTDDTAVTLDGMNRALMLLPAMLGADTPRDYILLFQNPAELRSTGGIPGALALIHTDDGSIELTRQASSTSFPEYPTPVLALGEEVAGIYGDITGQFIQNVTMTPDFAQSGALAREMWRLQFGIEANGVLSVDPVALSYLLEATGPITLATGDQLTADNAVSLLLQDAYARYDVPAEQDAFFAAAAGAVFDAIKSGRADSAALITALARAGAEHRILVWSADAAEQSILAETTLAGARPVSDSATKRFGLYFNDGTGSKMDLYLNAQTAIGQHTCRQDLRPQYALEVTLTNTAPADAATSLPPYVTGGGAFGVPPGIIKTVISGYGSPDVENLGVTRDGATAPYHPATDADHPVSTIGVELAPGESAVLRFTWLGPKVFTGQLELRSTPLIALTPPTELEFSC